MGWNCNITLKEPITKEKFRGIIAQLPEKIKSGFGEQEWGWSLAVDVRLRTPTEVGLSGSCGMSGDKAEPAMKAFVAALKKGGYGPEAGDFH